MPIALQLYSASVDFVYFAVCFHHIPLITDLDTVIPTKYNTRKLSKYLQSDTNPLKIPLP